MKKTFLIVFALVCAAVAQNSPLPTHTFTLTTSAISLPGDRGTFVGTDSGVAVSFTDRFDLAQTNIMSSDGKLNFFGGGAAYSFPVLSRYFNDKSPTISGFRVKLGIRAFAGVDRVKDPITAVTQQHWAEMVQGVFAYSLDSAATWTLGANVGMARFPGYAKGWTPIVEVGPSFHF